MSPTGGHANSLNQGRAHRRQGGPTAVAVRRVAFWKVPPCYLVKSCPVICHLFRFMARFPFGNVVAKAMASFSETKQVPMRVNLWLILACIWRCLMSHPFDCQQLDARVKVTASIRKTDTTASCVNGIWMAFNVGRDQFDVGDNEVGFLHFRFPLCDGLWR